MGGHKGGGNYTPSYFVIESPAQRMMRGMKEKMAKQQAAAEAAAEAAARAEALRQAQIKRGGEINTALNKASGGAKTAQQQLASAGEQQKVTDASTLANMSATTGPVSGLGGAFNPASSRASAFKNIGAAGGGGAGGAGRAGAVGGDNAVVNPGLSQGTTNTAAITPNTGAATRGAVAQAANQTGATGNQFNLPNTQGVQLGGG